MSECMSSPKKNVWPTVSAQYILVIIRGFYSQAVWWDSVLSSYSPTPKLPLLTLAIVSLIHKTDFFNIIIAILYCALTI